MSILGIEKQDQDKLAKILLQSGECKNCVYHNIALDDVFSDNADYIDVCNNSNNTIFSNGVRTEIVKQIECPKENICQYWKEK